MLGREIINYIFENNLEDKQIMNNGKIIGFITDEEAAKKFNVETGMIHVWINQGKMEGIRVNETVCVPYNSIDPRLNEISCPNILKC